MTLHYYLRDHEGNVRVVTDGGWAGGVAGGFAGAIGGGSVSGSLVDYFYSMEE